MSTRSGIATSLCSGCWRLGRCSTPPATFLAMPDPQATPTDALTRPPSSRRAPARSCRPVALAFFTMTARQYHLLVLWPAPLHLQHLEVVTAQAQAHERRPALSASPAHLPVNGSRPFAATRPSGCMPHGLCTSIGPGWPRRTQRYSVRKSERSHLESQSALRPCRPRTLNKKCRPSP